MQPKMMLIPCPQMRFNPHPSRRTGATRFRRVECSIAHAVSILTRPGGRVQLSSAAFRLLRSSGFQSSPVPEDGCNAMACRACSYPLMFQSSPVPEDGCNGRPARPRGRGRGGFNPHPSRRTGATGVEFSVNLGGQFQSSPVPEDGCNAPSGYSTTPSCGFQSSPVPEDGCN